MKQVSAEMKSETTESCTSKSHPKECNRYLEELRAKRNILKKRGQSAVNMTSEKAKIRNTQILKELTFSKERIQWVENEDSSNPRLKIMEKNYWSFVRSMKPLWEREISSVFRNN